MAFDVHDGITGSGRFATSRRGGIGPHEISEIERMKARGWGKQTIASILRRSVEDIGPFFDQEKPKAVHREPERRASYAAMSAEEAVVTAYGLYPSEARLVLALLEADSLSDDDILAMTDKQDPSPTYVSALIYKVRRKIFRSPLAIQSAGKGKGYRLPQSSKDELRRLIGGGA